MGEGLDKVARSLLDLQPTAILDLFLVFPDRYNKPDTFYPIHNGSSFKKGVVWQGVNYLPVSMEIEGFEVSADGRVNRPKLKISNKDYFVTNLLRNNDDFKNAKIVRKRTFVKFLDDINFDGGNPFGDSDSRAELSSQEYIVSQKVQENKIYVELELTSPLDLDNFEINHRRIMGKYCYWQYRGMGCQYRGVPLQNDEGKDFTDSNGNLLEYNKDFIYGDPKDRYDEEKNYSVGDLVYIENNRVFIEDPEGLVKPRPLLTYYIARRDVKGLRPDLHSDYWEKDGCNKKLSSCKLRFTETKTTRKYISKLRYSTKLSRLLGHKGTHYWLKPKNDFELRNAMSGTKEWTIVLAYQKIGRNYSYNGFLQTSDTKKYGGINLYNRKRRDYLSFFDGKKNRSIRLPRRRKEEYDYPIVIRKKNSPETGEYFIELWAPKYGNKRKRRFYSKVPINQNSAVDGNGDSLNPSDINNTFEVGRSTWKRNKSGNQRYLSSRTNLEAVCVWGRLLNNDEIDYLFTKLPEGGLRIKSYKGIKDDIVSGTRSLVKDLVLWCQEPFIRSSKRGIYDASPNGNDLIYNQSKPTTPRDFIITDTYTQNINKRVSTLEEISLLPFGGFPGTDGYSYTRSDVR